MLQSGREQRASSKNLFVSWHTQNLRLTHSHSWSPHIFLCSELYSVVHHLWNNQSQWNVYERSLPGLIIINQWITMCREKLSCHIITVSSQSVSPLHWSNKGLSLNVIQEQDWFSSSVNSSTWWLDFKLTQLKWQIRPVTLSPTAVRWHLAELLHKRKIFSLQPSHSEN